jgi:hypothetical protein
MPCWRRDDDYLAACRFHYVGPTMAYGYWRMAGARKIRAVNIYWDIWLCRVSSGAPRMGKVIAIATQLEEYGHMEPSDVGMMILLFMGGLCIAGSFVMMGLERKWRRESYRDADRTRRSDSN